MSSHGIESLLTVVEKSELFDDEVKRKVFKTVFSIGFDRESVALVKMLHNHPLVKPEDFILEMYAYMLKYNLRTPFTRWLLTSASYQDLLEIREHADGKHGNWVWILKTFSMSAMEEGSAQNGRLLKVIDDAISKADPHKTRVFDVSSKLEADEGRLDLSNHMIPPKLLTIDAIQDELNDCFWNNYKHKNED